MLRTQGLRSRGRSYTEAVKELDWRILTEAFKSTPADVILGGAPGALLDISCRDRGLGTILVLVKEGGG